MKTEWYDRTIQALQLNGKGERTQQAYARSVRMLTQFYDKSPDLITEQELQDYFLHRKNVNKWSPNTMRICYCGIRFAPCVFRVAISNSRLLKVVDRTVFIRYRKPHSHRLRTLALNVMESIRRFLQHVLPNGFMKVRYYGFMNPNCGIPLDRISSLIEMSYGFNVALPNTDLEPWQPITCPNCGGTLRLYSLLLPSRVLVWPG